MLDEECLILMNPLFYYSRLRRDLKEWVSRGWVSEENSARIQSHIEARGRARYQPASIALAAGILLILVGVIAFVGANWDGIPFGARLFILFANMLFLYAAANVVIHRDAHPWIAHSLFILVSGFFGANILLIAQIYNLNTGDLSAALMLWCAGALLTAWGARSPPTLYAVFATLLIYLHFLDRMNADPLTLFLFFSIAWSAATLTAWQWKWKQGFHIITIAFLYFMIQFTSALREFSEMERGAVFAISFFALFMGSLFLQRRPKRDAMEDSWLMQKLPIMERYAFLPFIIGFIFLYAASSQSDAVFAYNGFALAFLGLVGAALGASIISIYLQQKTMLLKRDALALFAITLGVLSQPYLPFFNMSAPLFWAHAAFVGALALWVIDFGMRSDNFWRFIGYLLFGAQLMHIYIRAFGSLLETSVFLILGGILLLAAAFGMHRFHLWSSAHSQNGDAPTRREGGAA